MDSGGDYDDSDIANKVYDHSANAITKEGPIYFIWEVKEGISTEEFQKFIDGPSGSGFGIDVLMNVVKPNRYIINEWTNSLYKSFHKQLSWIF